MKIAIEKSLFVSDPSAISTRLSGHQLPMEHFLGICYPPGGGVLSYYRVWRFPTKGVPIGDAVWQNNIVKKIILSLVKVGATFPVIYLIPVFFFFPRAVRKRLLLRYLSYFLEVAHWALDRWLLIPAGMCPAMRELHDKGQCYIRDHVSDGKERDLYLRFLHVICSIFEYDSAYRYRLQDILMELQFDKLRKNPIKEIGRLFDVIVLRERTGGLPAAKYRPFKLIAVWGLRLRPALAKIIVEIVGSLDISGISWEEMSAQTEWGKVPDYLSQPCLGFDYADWYHCLNAPTYDFGGIGLAERWALRKKIDAEWVASLKRNNQEPHVGKNICRIE